MEMSVLKRELLVLHAAEINVNLELLQPAVFHAEDQVRPFIGEEGS